MALNVFEYVLKVFKIVLEILKEYPNQLAELIDGKQKVLGFLVGQVMKKTNGTANPKEVNEIIRDEIKKG